MWPGLLASYRMSERLVGPRVVSGAMTEPRYLLTPNSAAAVLDREP
jgi:hypothetical protein